MFKTSYLTSKPTLFTKDKVANKVSDLKKLQEISKKNQETINDQIKILSEIHNLNETEVEHIFNQQIKLQLQKHTVQSFILSRSKKYGRKSLTFFYFLVVLLIVMGIIIGYKFGWEVP